MKTNYQRDAYRCGKRRSEEYDGRQDCDTCARQEYYDDSYDCDYDPKPRKNKHDDKKDHYPKPKETETILRCGTSTGSGPISCGGVLINGVASSSINSNNSGIVQATVALDTSGLVEPTVKLDFSSLISFRTSDNENFLLRLVFKLSRICKGSHVPLGTWTFERQSSVAVSQVNDFIQQSDSFSFSFCSCESCPDCCHYVVELVNQECFNITFATITNTSLTALAVGKKCF